MGFESFERAAGAGAQILSVERVGDGGGEGQARAFVLTFDVGSIVVRADPSGQCLAADVSGRDELPEGRIHAADEEPWWRVLGNPLVRVRAPDGGPDDRVRLQFRADGDEPRVIALSIEGALVRAGLEP